MCNRITLFFFTLSVLMLTLAPIAFADEPVVLQVIQDVDPWGRPMTITITADGNVSKEQLPVPAQTQQIGTQDITGTVRYVAPSGVNAGACNVAANPCQTLGYAVDQGADGDIIKMQIGSYPGPGVAMYKPGMWFLGGYLPGNWNQQVFSLSQRTIFHHTFTVFARDILIDNISVEGVTKNSGVIQTVEDPFLNVTIRRLILKNNHTQASLMFMDGSGTIENLLVISNTASIFNPGLAFSGDCGSGCYLKHATFVGNTGTDGTGGDASITSYGGTKGKFFIQNVIIDVPSLPGFHASTGADFTFNVLRSTINAKAPTGKAPLYVETLFADPLLGPNGELLYGPGARHGLPVGVSADILNRPWADSQRPDDGAWGFYGMFAETYLPLVLKQ
jgi:hypothetical protein